jgi:hypothetical protein
MKRLFLLAFIALSAMSAGCASSKVVLIYSDPSDAEVYSNRDKIGILPPSLHQQMK